MNILCQCGCGKETTINKTSKKYNKFIHGHNRQNVKVEFSESHKLNISKGKTGTHHSESVKLKIRKSHIGIIVSAEGRENISRSKTGLKATPETKIKMRLSAIERVARQYNNGEPCHPVIGFSERSVFDELEKITGVIITRQKLISGLGYWLDGFIADKNIALEFDEEGHFKKNVLREKDINRQIEIEKKTKSIFFRIREIEWCRNKSDIISKFKNLVESIKQ